ncbi:Ig-like domain-containing protein [Mycolicibacterium neworleansense]|uniref:WD40 domain-containing protein n=1 Tax=Mycolicibacterium neworleansense TaxID=146018 RepID=A0A0H5RSH6_9MYCO|nr:PD40 domain-containing protein [Mycolicibacterium neworleansense]MCV7363226.1 PD40 domain-containing protein [Mycolicibacterium neworleansense]CRZ17120.1 WD40 domain-containing protein [Mycolicibacterium neworleansense]
MTVVNPLINPQFDAHPSRRTLQATGRVGAYSGIVVTGWLVAALASGYGVAAADPTDTSSPDSSTSTSANATGGETAAGPTAGGAPGANSPSDGPGKSWAKKSLKPKRSGKTSSTKELAPGVTVSSSGGAQKDSGKPEGLPGAVEARLKALSSIPDQVRESVLTRNDGPEKPVLSLPTLSLPEISLPDVASPRAPEVVSDLDAKTGVPVGPLKLGDTLERSLAKAREVTDRVEQVTGTIGERVTEKVSEKIGNAGLATTKADSASIAAASDIRTTAEAVPTPALRAENPAEGALGVLNNIVTTVLNPFLAPAPESPEPFTPIMWAALAWVRRNAFNQAPVVSSPTTTVQTGQTVTGNIGVTDAEGDALTYTVTKAPEHGTLTINQETGEFTYTPDDINYEAAQTDSFTISVTDGNRINLLSLFKPRTAQNDIDVTVLNPTVERVILDLPDGIRNPNTPRFSEDGQSIYFGATPADGGRQEIYRISVDGSNVECITCGVSPEVTAGLSRVVPFQDGSGRLMIQVTTSPNSYVVYEETADGKQLVPVITPPSGARAIDPQREMRISPDGTHVLFSQIQMTSTGLITAVPVVGRLERTDAGYEIADARVVYPVGEGKQWTPDGKGVIILGGRYEAGNVDDIVVDLETGEVTRLTGNLDYDEDIDMSPNGQWIAVGSTRGYDALTPMSRIVRPAFLPADIQGAVYEKYRGTGDSTNITNQEWVIAIEDDLEGENGIPVFVDGDGYTARSMASWNNTGDAVAFWEASGADETDTRLVIAKLNYTTSVGPVQGDRTTPDPTWAPELKTYVPSTAPLPPTGTYAGAGGGTAVVTEVSDPTTGHIVRTVTYTDYVNEQGMILNGSESTDTTASQSSIHYVADITVTGTHTGYLDADATINKLQRTMTGHITSDLDGDVQSVNDQDRIDEDRANM